MMPLQAKLEASRDRASASLESPYSPDGRLFVYLAYLDDSLQFGWQVVAAALIPANFFFTAELLSALPIEDLMGKQKHRFEEFHASHLYIGEGVFKGIDESVRYAAISAVLGCLSTCEVKIGYGLVDVKALKRSALHSANAQDVAFTRCLYGISDWITSNAMAAMINDDFQGVDKFSTLFIMDEPAKGDAELKKRFQLTYRSLRSRFRFFGKQSIRIPFAHDDMYFGDSRYSIGIQIADLCAYFVGKHECGDRDSENFYQMIQPFIVSAGKDE